jgi:protein gp37
MGAETKIEWCDHTHNHWTGCTKVSPACNHCYAEGWAKRSGVVKWGPGEPRRMTTEANRRKPLKWDRDAAAAGVRRRVFCNSLADVFDAEVADAWRLDLMQLIHATPHLDWLLLTKRPQVAKKFFDHQAIPANVWLGTTVENQAMADLRIPILLSIPAKVRFLSCEPLLGPVDISRWLDRTAAGRFHAEPIIDWIICGGESGVGARDMDADWARSLRDQCQAAGVWFFMKQMARKAPIPADLLVREFPT